MFFLQWVQKHHLRVTKKRLHLSNLTVQIFLELQTTKTLTSRLIDHGLRNRAIKTGNSVNIFIGTVSSNTKIEKHCIREN